MENAKITVPNWDKYNPRKDLKTMPWLRLSSDISTDPKVMMLPLEAKWLFITVLCLCAKERNGEAHIEFVYISHVSGVAQDLIKPMLYKLAESGLITVSVRDTNVSDTDAPRIRAIRNERNETKRNERNEMPKGITTAQAPSRRASRFDAENLGEVLLSLPKKTIESWRKIYPNDQWRKRELEKAFTWYDQNPRKKPRTVQGWSNKLGGWLDRSWERQSGKGQTFAQKKSQNNASLVERARKGEFDDYEN